MDSPSGRSAISLFAAAALFAATVAAVVVFPAASVTAAPPRIDPAVPIADLNESPVGSQPQTMGSFGGDVIFSATDPIHGRELWRFDPSTDTVELVADITPGVGDSYPSYGVESAGRFYFSAAQPGSGSEFWSTDGTAAGTRLEQELRSGSQSSSPRDFVVFDGAVLFVADDGIHGKEIWRFDGTTATMIADINPSGSSDPSEITEVAFGSGASALYFSAVGPAGRQLFRYDENGAVNSYGVSTSAGSPSVSDLSVVGDTLYVAARNTTGNFDLVRVQGATPGSVTTSVLPVSGSVQTVRSAGPNVFALTNQGGPRDLYVVANSTATPSLLVDDESLSGVFPFGDRVVFNLTDALGREPWISDGTLPGTKRILDIDPGPGSSNVYNVTPNANGSLGIFSAETSSAGRQIWRTDGTAAGTFAISDPDGDPITIYPLAVDTGGWFFAFADAQAGDEPWFSGGTSATTRLVQDINTATQGSYADEFVDFDGIALFGADRGTGLGYELYRFDPAAGTVDLVLDIDPGDGSSSPQQLVALDDVVVFAASTDVDGRELWRTDGTAGGTTMIADLAPGPSSTTVNSMVRAGDLAFFTSDGDRLWRTDGTAAGTFELDAEPPSYGQFTVGTTGVLYEKDDLTSGREPWFSDGTVAGTQRLADTQPGAGDGSPSFAAPVSPELATDELMYFTSNGSQLWVTGGTPATTSQVPLTPPAGTELSTAVRVGDDLLLEFEDDTSGVPSLHRSEDGGTTLTEIAGPSGAEISLSTDRITVVGGRTIAGGYDDGLGDDVLISIDDSTYSVLELPSLSVDSVDEIVTVDDVAFVVVTIASTSNAVLFATDGTPDGGSIVFRPDERDPGLLRDLTPIADRHLVFSSNDPSIGEEGFVIDTRTVPTAPTGVTAVAGEESAVVSWTPPLDDDGSPVTSYLVTSTPGGRTCTTSSTSCTVSGLIGGTSYTFKVAAASLEGSSVLSSPSNAVTPTSPSTTEPPSPTTTNPTTPTTTTPTTTPPPVDGVSDVVSLTPGRVLETRPGEVTVDGVAQPGERVGAMDVIEVPVAGRAGVADDAVAAVLNVTAIKPGGPGFLTIFPCGGDMPLASSLNYAAGDVVGNEVVAKLSSAGSVCVFTQADSHLTADVVGFVPAGSPIESLEPSRVLETRPGEVTVDGVAQGGGRVAAMEVIEVQIAGRGGVAVDAVAAVLNVTAIKPGGPGFLTIFPCGGDMPLASSLNYAVGDVVGNEVVAKLSATGSVCIYTQSDTHLTADVVGFVPSGAGAVSLTPGRVLETRPGEVTVDGKGQVAGRVGAMSEIEVQIAGRGNVPASGASAAVMNVTAIKPGGPGFLTIFPCGDRPLASSLNYGPGDVVGNEVIAKLSATGSVCVYTQADTHLTIDVVGYIPT